MLLQSLRRACQRTPRRGIQHCLVQANMHCISMYHPGLRVAPADHLLRGVLGHPAVSESDHSKLPQIWLLHHTRPQQVVHVECAYQGLVVVHHQ